MTLSVCMIVKDEEKNLGKALDCVKPIADEIIVVDTGSSDKTKDIAQEKGADVFDFAWCDDFSAARNECLKHVSKEWILFIDADEVISEDDVQLIPQLIKETPERIGGYKFSQYSYMQKPFLGCKRNKDGFVDEKEYPFYVRNRLVRLFRNHEQFSFRHRVHELIEDSIREKGFIWEPSSIVLHHFGSDESKKDYYEKLIMMQLQDQPDVARYNYQAAKMYEEKKDFTKALAHMKKVAQLDPDYKLVYSEIAKLYLATQNYEQALAYFDKSMQQKPDDLSAPNNAAVVLMGLKKFEEAKSLLKPYVEKHPENEALKHNSLILDEFLKKQKKE